MSSNLRILMVDDSARMRRIIIGTLRRAGHLDVTEAADGKDALEKLRQENFDLVITDWNMPEMDGLAFVMHVRSDRRLRHLPILMVAITSVKDEIQKAFKAGINDYIVKPFTAETLSEKISSLLASA